MRDFVMFEGRVESFFIKESLSATICLKSTIVLSEVFCLWDLYPKRSIFYVISILQDLQLLLWQGGSNATTPLRFFFVLLEIKADVLCVLCRYRIYNLFYLRCPIVAMSTFLTAQGRFQTSSFNV